MMQNCFLPLHLTIKWPLSSSCVQIYKIEVENFSNSTLRSKRDKISIKEVLTRCFLIILDSKTSSKKDKVCKISTVKESTLIKTDLKQVPTKANGNHVWHNHGTFQSNTITISIDTLPAQPTNCIQNTFAQLISPILYAFDEIATERFNEIQKLSTNKDGERKQCK